MLKWICHYYYKNERFVDQRNTVVNQPIDVRQNEIEIIQPPKYNAYDTSIQSGSLFIPQPEYYTTQGDKVTLDNYNITSDVVKDDMTNIGDNGLNFNLCSPACCSDQWPLPFKTPVDTMTCQNKDEFVPTSYFCNNGWQNSGCLCLRKDQNDFLTSRGYNTDI